MVLKHQEANVHSLNHGELPWDDSLSDKKIQSTLHPLLTTRLSLFFYGQFTPVHVAQAAHDTYLLSLCVYDEGTENSTTRRACRCDHRPLSHKVCNPSQTQIGPRTSFKMRMQNKEKSTQSVQL